MVQPRHGISKSLVRDSFDNTLSRIRRVAQAVRHAPVLDSLTPVWRALRGPYLWVLKMLGSARGIPVRVGGTPMRLHPDFATQNWETVEYASYRAFAEMLRPGDVVFDVGAHIGTYTLIALDRIGALGRVVAYEPNELTSAYLKQHLEWNGGVERTIVRELCCGQSPGSATFYFMPGRAEGMNGLVPVDGFSKRQVAITTLDQEGATLELTPTVIKIDVEGAEWEVLKGAEAVLAEFHPRLSLSLHPAALAKQDARPEEVLAWLQDHGYETTIIGQDHEIHVVARAA